MPEYPVHFGCPYPIRRRGALMKRNILISFAGVVAIVFAYSAAPAQRPAAVYFPERFEWQHRSAEQVGMDGALVQQAVQAAIAADSPGPHDMTQFLKQSFGK